MSKPHVKLGNYVLEYEEIPYESVKAVKTVPIKTLKCCCCGERTKGRQWWNRDTGFGLCEACAQRIEKREDSESMRSCYGEKGTHYCIA